MRKTLLIGLFLLLLVASMYWYSNADSHIFVQSHDQHSWLITHNNVEDLEKSPQIDLIIRGVVTKTTEPILITSGLNAIPPLEYKAMRTDVTVEAILKPDYRMTGNEVIPIIEPTYITERGGLLKPGKIEEPFNSYLKTEPGRSYIFFLTWNDKHQAYWVYGDYQGKVNVDGSDDREIQFALTNEDFRLLRQSVIDKYVE